MKLRRIIILKEFPDTDGNTCLRNYLPPLLNQVVAKKKFSYMGLSVLITRVPLQQARNRNAFIEKIIKSESDIIIIPAFPDAYVKSDRHLTLERLVNLLNRMAPRSFIFEIMEAGPYDTEAERDEEKMKSAHRIKNYIDSFVAHPPGL